MIAVDTIATNKWNPRTIDTKSAKFIELLDSVKAQGIIEPVHVRVVGKNQYELLAGSRRLMACQMAKIEKIPAIDHGQISDEQAFEITYLENFAREDLTPLEEGKAASLLVEKYEGDVQAAASKMGKSVSWIMQRRAIHENLNDAKKKELQKEESSEYYAWLTAGHLQLIASLPSEVQQSLWESRVWENKSVKVLKDFIGGMMRRLDKAPWSVEDSFPFIIHGKKKNTRCCQCEKRSSFQPGLFDDTLDVAECRKKDRCLDMECWAAKKAAWIGLKFIEQSKQHEGMMIITNKSGFGELINEYGQAIYPLLDSGKLLYQNNYRFAKKGDKNAVPAMMMDGEKIGEIKYIIPNHQKQQTEAGKKTEKPKTLKEKQAELESKRWFMVLRYMIREIDKKSWRDLRYKDLPPSEILIRLAAAFGLQSPHLWSGDDKHWEEFVKLCEQTGDKTYDELWVMLKPQIKSLITYNDALTRTPQQAIYSAKQLAGLLQIDIAKLMADAAKEYPTPKNWETKDVKQ